MYIMCCLSPKLLCRYVDVILSLLKPNRAYLLSFLEGPCCLPLFAFAMVSIMLDTNALYYLHACMLICLYGK